LLEQFEKVVVPYEKIRDINIRMNQPFLLCVERDGVSFDFLIRLKENSEKLFVLASGAYDSNKFSPPVFQRHSWMDKIEESVIFFNDPTLYLGKINLGWGFGNEKRHFLEEVSEVLTKIFISCKIPNKNVLFYGSSAGGFMSILLAGFMKESKALVNNPQTIVNNYFASHVNRLFSVALPGYTAADILKQYSYRLNLIEFFKKVNYVPEIYYLQNIACEHDMTKHLTPFISALKEINESFDFQRIHFDLYFDKEKDHNPLDMDETLSYLHKLIMS
jgi:hypothetical protein